LDIPLSDILTSTEGRILLEQLIPGILDNPMLVHMKTMNLKNLRDMSRQTFDPKVIAKLDKVMEIQG